MAKFVQKDIGKALRNMLRGWHTFSDRTRNDAIIEVRDIGEDRIHVNRRPAGVTGPWINITVIGEEPSYTTQAGRSDRSITFVEVSVYSDNPAERTALAAAVTVALDHLSGVDVDVDDYTLQICNCYQESGADDDDRVPDASGDYQFSEDLTFRVQYVRTAAVKHA